MGGEIVDKQWNTNFEVQVQFLHSLHDGNQCADFLVRTGSSQTSTCELWFHHLPGMDQDELLLAADIMGIALLSVFVFVYTIFCTQKEGGPFCRTLKFD
ncbi:hypothetical protein POPTR_007G081750v4 [Populus trichocarpa]|uniref:Uncharacterized protein n=1 Tax=Populus trichocarpa TaxID=3694 RepID=A0ACC0SQD5_POPTR|nr:hypothetical protein POPTR_007G081750v4 [Populus trichocarpa]